MKKMLLPIMVFSWSIYYVLCDYIIDIIGSPYLTGFFLRAITFVILTVFLLVGKKFSFEFNNKKFFVFVVLIGILAFVFDSLINVGLKYSTATTGTALLKTEMIFVLLLNSLFGKKKIEFMDGVLAFFMACGSFLIVMGDWNHFSVDWWSLLFVLSAFLNTICAYSIKRIQEKYDVSSYQIAYVNNTISLIMYFAIVVIADCNFFANQFEYIGTSVPFVVILCGGCQSTLMLTYYCALGKHEVWIVKTVLLIIPIFTLICDVALQEVAIFLPQLIGLVITIGAALLMILKDRQNNNKKETNI